MYLFLLGWYDTWTPSDILHPLAFGEGFEEGAQGADCASDIGPNIWGAKFYTPPPSENALPGVGGV